MFWAISFPCFSYSQTVTLNQIPQFSCPAGNMNICGTFTAPPVGGPFQPPTFNVSIVGVNVAIPVLVNGGTNITATIIGNTYCLNIPVTVFGTNPQQGTYEIEITANFSQINPPFAITSVDATGTNPNSSDDIFLGNCPIVANNDAVTFNQCANQTINVLANDTFLGVAAALNTVTITPIGATAPIILNTVTGIASIPVGTVAGTYTANYQICNLNNTTQCDPATITFTITAPPIVANNDTFSLNTCTGISTTSVLNNDTICGTPIATTVFVSFVGVSPIAGATINNLGVITIPVGTPQGSYTFSYNVCPTAFPTGCSNTATVSITVTNQIFIIGNDVFNGANAINTLTGGTTGSVFINDTLGGAPVNATNAIITIVSVTLSDLTPVTIVGLTVNPNGTITIPDGTPINTYIVNYQITQVGCSNNVVFGFATIMVNEQIIITPTLVAGLRANEVVSIVDTQSSGKIIIVGQFTKYNGMPCSSIARLKTDLTLDTTNPFNTSGPTPINNNAYDMKIYKNAGINFNKILLVGQFTGFSGGSNGVGIARLMPNGDIDTSFNATYTGINKGVSGVNSTIYSCYIYPDTALDGNAGKILIGGSFDKYNNEPRHKIARLMPDGSLDFTFNPNIFNSSPFYRGPGFSSAPRKFLVDSIGNIIVGGYFQYFNNVRVNGITRLTNSGLLEATFNNLNTSATRGITTDITNIDYNMHIEDMVLQTNGSIIIGGVFRFYNGSSRNNIARLFSTGVLDTTFNVGTGFNNTTITNPTTGTYGLVRSFSYVVNSATESRLYVAGDFTQYKGLAVDEVIRLVCTSSTFAIGSNEPTAFSMSGGGPNGTVWSLKRQGDGKLILGGRFTNYNVYAASNITRILPASGSNEARNTTMYYDSEPEIDLFASKEVIIYPNPSTGIFAYSSSCFINKKFKITVYNTLGQKVFEKKDLSTEDTTLNLSELSNGSYFVNFISPSVSITKILIVK